MGRQELQSHGMAQRSQKKHGREDEHGRAVKA